MRLWHKDLIPVLPKQQLLGQWRECCCIARNIANKHTPNHLLVNKVMDYQAIEFVRYAGMVHDEMVKRGYDCDWDKFIYYITKFPDGYAKRIGKELFEGWHNDRYLMQCFYNLQEKYDCGGIPQNEWKVIDKWMKRNKHNNGYLAVKGCRK